MENTVSNQLNYKIYDYNTLYINILSIFQYLPVSGRNSWTISVAGQEILIELPVKAYNLSKSILYFQVVLLDVDAAGQIRNEL
jgi:hypothetical protein